MRKTFLSMTVAAITLSVVALPGTAISAPAQNKVFGKGMPYGLDDLPSGRAKSRLETLPPAARQQALRWLQSFSFPEQDLEYLRFDEAGGVLYADTNTVDHADTEVAEGTTEVSTIAPEDTFRLHSRPGAAKVVFLDFDGHTITGTIWNSAAGIDPFFAQPYDTDGSPDTFSGGELSNIQEIWHRIAEDFAPFNIDVTTEDPGAFGSSTGRVLITHNVDATNQSMPYASSGGVAYVGVFGSGNYQHYSPALVYYNNLGGGFPTYVAEAASHEFGHNLGLGHDGRGEPYNEGYYKGHGTGYVSWAPVMGIGYTKNVTQWSKGEYEFANNQQDDLSQISLKLGYRSDDHNEVMSSATPLVVEADGSIWVTTPETENVLAPSLANKGVIESSADVDLFSFDADAGAVEITIQPAWAAFYRSDRRGANLDISATLYNLSGSVIAVSDPQDNTDALISATVPAGSYFLAISGTGNMNSPYSDYASLGQYFISGSITPGDVVVVDPPAAPSSLGAVAVSHAQINLNWADNASNETGFVIERSLDQVSWIQVAILAQNSTSHSDIGLAAATLYAYRVRAINGGGNAVSNIATAATQTQPVAPVAPSGTAATDGGDGTATISWIDNSSNETGFEVQREMRHKKRNTWQGTSTVGAVAADVTQLTNASGAGVFRYRSRAINAVGASAWSAWAVVTVTDGSGGGSGGSGKCHPKRGC